MDVGSQSRWDGGENTGLISLRTQDVPEEDRFESWRQAVGRAVVPVELSSRHREDFLGSVASVGLGEVQASVLTFPSLEARRTPELIRCWDPGQYHLAVNLGGGVATVGQDGQHVILRPRDFTVYSTSRPLGLIAAVDPQLHSRAGGHATGAALVVALPRGFRTDRAHHDRLRRLVGARGVARGGFAGPAVRWLVDTVRSASQYSSADRAKLQGAAVELLQTVFDTVDPDPAKPPEALRQAFVIQIHDYINRHLSDASLSSQSIAAAHAVSERTLQRALRVDGHTVHDLVRNLRLDRSRRELDQHPDRAINVLAAMCGFASQSHFAQAFRRAFGLTPTEYRALVIARRQAGTVDVRDEPPNTPVDSDR
jgi:AraC-like DNA-binding protein